MKKERGLVWNEMSEEDEDGA